MSSAITRPGVGLRSDGLPDIDWIEIPGGQVKLENIDHVFEVKPFRMAKYLVTNAQFDAFIKAEDGYRNEEWWNGMERSEEVSVPHGRKPIPHGKRCLGSKPWPFVDGSVSGRGRRFAYPLSGNGNRRRREAI